MKDVSLQKSAEFVDKVVLGKKSSKGREEYISKIIAMILEVLKSDESLEELDDKVLISDIPLFGCSYLSKKRRDENLEGEKPIEADQKLATFTFLDKEGKITEKILKEPVI